MLGHKKIETRSRNTKHRGPLLIHASLGKKPAGKYLYSRVLFEHLAPSKSVPYPFPMRGFRIEQLPFDELPFGAIIGMVNVVSTCGTNNHVVNDDFYKKPGIGEGTKGKFLALTSQEEAFGDYSPGRYGYLFSNPVMFDSPIPAKGNLGLWNYDRPLPF